MARFEGKVTRFFIIAALMSILGLMMTVAGLAQSTSDPECLYGIPYGHACCEESCGTCGGSGCAGRPGGADSCCVGNIMSANRSCTDNLAPCVLPDPKCERGLENGSICCPKTCETCGGTDCGDRPGGADSCCVSNILNANISCANKRAPCVIPDPECLKGIKNGSTCCAEPCGTCGGIGCGDRPGGANSCCVEYIQDAGLSCSESLAPCVIPAVD